MIRQKSEHQLLLDVANGQAALALHNARVEAERESIFAAQELADVRMAAENTVQVVRAHARSEIDRISERIEYVEAQMQAMRNSTSWRLTKPVRLLGRFVKRLAK